MLRLCIPLLLFCTVPAKGQQPFTGKIMYTGLSAKNDTTWLNFDISYASNGIRMNVSGSSPKENVPISVSLVHQWQQGYSYTILPFQQKAMQTRFTYKQKAKRQLVADSGFSRTILGQRASRYSFFSGQELMGYIWYADSLYLTIPDSLQFNDQAAGFAFKKVLLEAMSIPGNPKSEVPDLFAIQIEAGTDDTSLVAVPTGYTIIDEASLQKKMDSLMAAFKTIDSSLVKTNAVIEKSALLRRRPGKGAKKAPSSPARKNPPAATLSQN